ncbi:MAG: hypothetical protein LBC63_00100 [Holophagales bacterium]|jgi:hypothetical protein|nr:hypothetical protein [Holophagales bacterium]
MSEMDDIALSVLEDEYGKPLEDRGEIERRFKNAVGKINVAKMKEAVATCGEGGRCYSPPYHDKIGLYFGDDIETVDEWDKEICENGFYYIPHGWCNRQRILIRGDWAAYVLSGDDGEKEMAGFLESIVSGAYWWVII